MIRCSFCGRNFHIESLRSFRPDCANGDPRPAITGGRVYACAPCDRKRERFIRAAGGQSRELGASEGGGMMPNGTLPLRLYCTCGAAWLSTPLDLSVAVKMLKEFGKAHKGPDHILCDAKTAARARRRAERQAAPA